MNQHESMNHSKQLNSMLPTSLDVDFDSYSAMWQNRESEK